MNDHFEVEDSGRSLGVIAPFSDSTCARCRRLRPAAEAKVGPWLGRGPTADPRELLRAGAMDGPIVHAVLESVRSKPGSHGQCGRKKMGRIAG